MDFNRRTLASRMCRKLFCIRINTSSGLLCRSAYICGGGDFSRGKCIPIHLPRDKVWSCRGLCSGRDFLGEGVIVHGEYPGVRSGKIVRIPVQNYKSLRIAVMIWSILVNTHTHRVRERLTDSFQPFLANVNSRSRSLLRQLKFSAMFYTIWYLCHLWPFCKKFTEIVSGEPLRRGVKPKG